MSVFEFDPRDGGELVGDTLPLRPVFKLLVAYESECSGVVQRATPACLSHIASNSRVRARSVRVWRLYVQPSLLVFCIACLGTRQPGMAV